MKKRQIVIYIVLMLACLCTSVYATISGSLNLTASPTSVPAGEEFDVTLTLDDIDTSIKSLTIYIDIDEDVLEDLTVESIVTNSDGAVEINSNNTLTVYDISESGTSADNAISFNSNATSADYLILVDLSNAISSETDIMTITFKAQSDLSVGTYADAIKVKYMLYSTSDKSTLTSESLDVTIVSASQGNSSNNNNNNASNNNSSNNATNNNATNNASNNTNNNASNNSNNNTSNNSSNNSTNNTSNNNSTTNNTTNNTTDNTTASGSLPNTGYRLIVVPIIILAVLGFVFYKKYSKYNKI